MTRDPAVVEIETALAATFRRADSHFRRFKNLSASILVDARRPVAPLRARTIEPQASRGSVLRCVPPQTRK